MKSAFDSLERSKASREQQGKYKEILDGTEWLGVIVASDDNKNFDGRCKVRVFEKFDEIADEDLPWCFPVCSNIFSGGSGLGAGSFSYPRIGTLVRVKFNNGDIYHPEYSFIQNLNYQMIEELKQSYINSTVLLYDEDEDIKIMYTQGV